jgi:HD-like signal output (HDOD) protein/CheY-like chemotaxis protein
MVVERNPRIGNLIAGKLREHGFQTIDVRNGAEAAWELRSQLCDLILMDHRVPMGGVKTARLLRLHPKYRALPIVLGLPTDQEEARQVVMDAQQVGLSHFLIKPFSLDSLQKKMQEILKIEEERPPPAQPTDQEIRQEIRQLSNLPAMSAAHTRLLLLLSKPDDQVDLVQVARTVETDPSLATKVMRTCRSAYYGFQGRVMRQAVAFLGVQVMRKIVQSAIIYSVMGNEGPGEDLRLSMMDLWRHSLAVGMGMEIIGKADKMKIHFLLGLGHDLGKAIFKFRFPDHYRKVLDLVQEENLSILQAEEKLLGITHCESGGELALHWELPGEVRSAIIGHHNPSSISQHRRLAAMVQIADIAARTMKIGYAGDNLIPEMDPYARRMRRSLEEITAQKDDFIRQTESILGNAAED